MDVEAGNLDRPYAVGKHDVAPQVESCSASRQEFMDSWVGFLADVFGAEFKHTHLVFVFDPEYVPHYISWLYDTDAARKLLNTILCPHKFHFRKHVAEVSALHRAPSTATVYFSLDLKFYALVVCLPWSLKVVLAHKYNLLNFWAPLLSTVIQTSVKKWSAAGVEAMEFGAADESAARTTDTAGNGTQNLVHD